MPNEFYSTYYWKAKKDFHLPREYPGEHYNAIFTMNGMRQIAQYYREKYDIEIYPFSSAIESAPEKIKDIINQAKMNKINKCGLIFWTGVHAIPLLWEKGNLFFLDSLAYMNNDDDDHCKSFRKQLTVLIPDIQIWTYPYKRQVDKSSCTIDALTILKDGLRIPMLKVAQAKLIKQDYRSVNIFNLPEELLKTAQIGSCLIKSQADLKKEIITGKHNKHITLGDFRKKDAITTEQHYLVYEPKKTGLWDDIVTFFGGRQSREVKEVVIKKREFSSFTFRKGVRYTELIKKRWEMGQALLSKIKTAHDELSSLLTPYDDSKMIGVASDQREVDLEKFIKTLLSSESDADEQLPVLKKAYALHFKLGLYIRLFSTNSTILDYRDIRENLNSYALLIDSLQKISPQVIKLVK